MPSHAGRLYAVALTLVAFFLGWAVVAAHPWAATSSSPQLQALAVRQAALRREAKLVQTIVAQRKQLAAARASASSGGSAASVPVKVVNLPPLTVTRTS